MKRRKKTFDSVQFMRDARDRISRDIQGMTYEEEKKYLQDELSKAVQMEFRANLKDTESAEGLNRPHKYAERVKTKD